MRGADHLDWLVRGREREAGARARAIADELGLPLAKKVRAYSHGMKRQLLFAAALAPRVRVRILDEPSDGLDPNMRSVMIRLLEEDAKRGTTILLSSHHLGEVDRVCDAFVFLDQGRRLRVDSAEELARRARRLMRIEFAPSAVLARVCAAHTWRSARATLRDTTLFAELFSDDPREFLAELAEARDLPPPIAIEYGPTSLQELYRNLYGVAEAV